MQPIAIDSSRRFHCEAYGEFIAPENHMYEMGIQPNVAKKKYRRTVNYGNLARHMTHSHIKCSFCAAPVPLIAPVTVSPAHQKAQANYLDS